MARPADVVDNMWKKTTVVPQRMAQILNNGRMICAERQLSKMGRLKMSVYLAVKKRARADQRSSAPIGASLGPFPIQKRSKYSELVAESPKLAISVHSSLDCYAGIREYLIGI